MNIIEKTYTGTLPEVVCAVWDDLLVPKGCGPVPEETVVEAVFDSRYAFADRLRNAVGDENAPVQSMFGVYYCISFPGQDWKSSNGFRESAETWKAAFWKPKGDVRGMWTDSEGVPHPYSSNEVWENLSRPSIPGSELDPISI